MLKSKNKNQSKRNPVETQGSSPVFSYYSNRARNEETAARPQSERKLARSPWLRYAPSFIAGAMIIVSAAYAVYLNTNPRIVMVSNTVPGKVINPADYQKNIQNILASSLLNRNKMTFQSDKVTQMIKQQYPELGDIAVTVPLLGQRPVVTIAPSPATLVITNQQSALVVDSSGRAIADARMLSLNDILVISDESGLELEQGKPVLPKDYVTFITTIKYLLDSKQLSIDSVTLPKVANELHVRLKDRPYYIKYNLRSDPRQQTGALIALIEQLTAKNIVPSEYIDLRVDERVFYK